MSVIGFDIGNESCVIAAAKRGGVQVLLDDEAKCETPAVVSFGEKQRFLGSAGAAFATAYPKSTIPQIKRLIGKVYKEVEEELKMLPFATSEGPRGGILIELEYLKKKWTFTPVEILAMLLKHLKQITENNLEARVVDCVIGIPSYFTDLQRRLYLDAANIAGLKPLRLMHDGTAIASGYGMYKTDLSDSRPTNVMFVDIGHCDTQVTVAAFVQGETKILSHAFDQNLGGRDFDEVLFHHFAAQFKEKYKIDVYASTRASTRLMVSCEKVKKVLSANVEAPLSIECLIGVTDVRGRVTKEEFENLSSMLLERVTVPCSMALKDSGLSTDKIYAIELVGSGSHIPAISKIIKFVFEKEPTRTLNASECVAKGCALCCAILSPDLVVRDYKIKDIYPYSIVLPLPEEELALFPKGTPYPNRRLMKHEGNNPFYFQVAYINDTYFPAGISQLVGHFAIGTFEASDAENVKVEVEFRVKLNYHGIVEIDSATILEDIRLSGWNSLRMLKTDNRQMLNLPFSENLDFATTNDELHECKEKDKMLTEQDIKVEEIKDQRNTLESFVYNTRSELSGVYRSYATDSEKRLITKTLQETEDWLYEDSDDEAEQDYTRRLKELKKILEPIENRYNDENALAKETKALQSCIAKYYSLANLLPADKKEKVKDQCIKAEKWLSSLSQNDLSPKMLSTKINHAIGFVGSNCRIIISSKPSLSRNEERVDSENASAKAAKPLQTCIAEYYSFAESLPHVKKEKVKNVCKEVEQWLVSFVSQKNLSPKTLSADINQAIKTVDKHCKSIISESSFSWHEEPTDSNQREQRVELERKDQFMESENGRRKATKALQACISAYRSRAESLTADKKEHVKEVCIKAEQWLSNLSQSQSSSYTYTADINRVIEGLESRCKSIIFAESSFQRHEERPEDSDVRKQTVVLKDQLVNSENGRTKATKALEACIAKYRLHVESLPANMKDKVEDLCIRAEQWLNSRSQSYSSAAFISSFIESFESNCESIIRSTPSFARHEEPVESDQRDYLWTQIN